MYFAAKGDNHVSISESQQKEFKNFKILKPGDHFGEIGLLYGCPRTASVVSEGYNTYARLTKERFRNLISEVPTLLTEFEKHVFSYNDKVKKFILKALAKLPFLVGVEEGALHSVLYLLQHRQYEKGSSVFKPGEDQRTFRIVKEGQIELYVSFGLIADLLRQPRIRDRETGEEFYTVAQSIFH